MTELPDYNKISFPEYEAVSWEKLFPGCTSEAKNLLSNFLVYSANKRIKAEEAIIHDYIFAHPLPCCDCDLPKPNSNLHGFMPNIPSPELEISDKVETITNHLKIVHLDTSQD